MTTIVAATLGALAVVFAAVYSVRATRRAQTQTEAAAAAITANQARVAEVRADGEAYARAQKIYQDILAELQEQMARQQRELTDVRRQLALEQQQSADLEQRLETLQTSVNRMRALLIENNIPIPAEA